MAHSACPRRPRFAFTLVELMVVVLIIAILVSLVSAAVFKAMGQIPITQTSSDIGQLGAAIGSFRADFQIDAPPPSSIWICENRAQYSSNAAYTASLTYFQKIFGKNFATTTPPAGFDDWNGNGAADAPYLLTGPQCLVFWLGGVPQSSGGTISMTGFAKSNIAPAAPATPGENRRGPYFQFAPSRLVIDPRCPSYPVYRDPYEAKAQPQPYAYFSTGGRMNGYSAADSSTIGASIYYTGLANGSPAFLNNNTYQIVSAGADGVFGYDAATPNLILWSPTSGFPNTSGLDPKGQIAGNDDQSNFSSGTLNAGQR